MPELIETITDEEFAKLSETMERAVIDWDEVARRLAGKNVTRAGIEKTVNDVKGTPGKKLWWTVWKTHQDKMIKDGTIEAVRYGSIGGRRVKVYKFSKNAGKKAKTAKPAKEDKTE